MRTKKIKKKTTKKTDKKKALSKLERALVDSAIDRMRADLGVSYFGFRW